jgi:hypothetical protein
MNVRLWLLPVLLGTLPIASADAALPGKPPGSPFVVASTVAASRVAASTVATSNGATSNGATSALVSGSAMFAGAATAPGANEVGYLAGDTRNGASLLVDGHADSVAFRVASADPHRMMQTQFAGDSARAAADSSGVTLLDVALMMLFGVGLVAYQLERKQRMLRQSSLLPAPPD